jgi:hypothetical protein
MSVCEEFPFELLNRVAQNRVAQKGLRRLNTAERRNAASPLTHPGRIILTVTLVVAAATANAATLTPDSLLCERPDEIAFIAQSHAAEFTATKAIGSASRMAEFYALDIKRAAEMRDHAAKEKALRANAGRFGTGSTTARETATADLDQEEAVKEEAAWRRVAETCASSGQKPLPVSIAESRPISGLSKLTLQFRGTDSSLWTATRSLQP